MDADQARVYDQVAQTTGRVTGHGQGFIFAPRLWEISNRMSAYFTDCSLSPAQVRMLACMAARFWKEYGIGHRIGKMR